MEHYELVYLLRLSVSDSDAESIKTAITKLLESKGAKIEKYGDIGKRKLAYEIDHETHANYWMVQFQVDTQAVAELHRMLTLEGKILRFLIVAQEPKSAEDIERERLVKERLEKDEFKERQQLKEKERQEKVEEEKKAKPEVAEKAKETKKLSLEELDEKLDELLDDESLNT